MNFRNFTSRLAGQLASGAWSFEMLESQLKNTLPKRFKNHAPVLAQALTIQFPKTYAPSRRAIGRILQEQPAVKSVWLHAQKHNVWPEITLLAASFSPTDPFTSLNLPVLSSSDDLADWLGISPENLVRFSDKRGLSNQTQNAFAPHYRYHTREKSSGAHRLIEEPKPFLKTLQRRILSGLLDLIPPSPSAFGFVKGRDCLSAAARHGGEAMLACFDLRSFFPSINHTRIFGLFRTLGYPEAVAHDLTGLCTVSTAAHILSHNSYDNSNLLSRRHLPQGAPTSPALANLSAFNLDRRLAGLARSIDANYSRYADDMIFSGDQHITRTLRNAVPVIVADEGFSLQQSKTRFQPSYGRQITTGLVVNQKVNITRQNYDLLKATIHHLGRADNPRRNDRHFIASLSGQINWVERVNPTRGYKLRTRFDIALSA